MLAVALTLSAIRWASGRALEAPAEIAPAAERAARLHDSHAEAVDIAIPGVRLDNLTRPAHAEPSANPFGATSWEQMARDEGVRNAPPPPPPQAPPLPFTYVGKLVEGDKVTVFLVRQGQDQNYIVRDGDAIDGIYRVETIDERTLILTYMPLNQQQTLAFGEAN